VTELAAKATSVEKVGEFWPARVLAFVPESVYPPSNFQKPSRSEALEKVFKFLRYWLIITNWSVWGR